MNGIIGRRKSVPTVTIVTTVNTAGGIRASRTMIEAGRCERPDRMMSGIIIRGTNICRIPTTSKAALISTRENRTPTPIPTEMSARYVVSGPANENAKARSPVNWTCAANSTSAIIAAKKGGKVRASFAILNHSEFLLP